MLPAAPGFARKVKPLVRLGEREMAAYCVLRGIDYQVEECPMAAGNRHLGYKEVLNALEDRSPGSKAAFLFGFLERGARPLRRRGRRRSATSCGACTVCGAPTTGDALRVLPAPGAGRRHRAARRRAPRATDALTWPGAFAAGDRVLLVDAKQRRHLVTLAEGGEFHTHAGRAAHDDLIGRTRARPCARRTDARLIAVRPRSPSTC